MCIAEQTGDGQNAQGSSRGATNAVRMGPKNGLFQLPRDVVTPWKGGKRGSGAEIAEFERNSPALQTECFNMEHLSPKSCSGTVLAVSHFQAELHIKNFVKGSSNICGLNGPSLSSCLCFDPVLGSKRWFLLQFFVINQALKCERGGFSSQGLKMEHKHNSSSA